MKKVRILRISFRWKSFIGRCENISRYVQFCVQLWRNGKKTHPQDPMYPSLDGDELLWIKLLKLSLWSNRTTNLSRIVSEYKSRLDCWSARFNIDSLFSQLSIFSCSERMWLERVKACVKLASQFLKKERERKNVDLENRIRPSLKRDTFWTWRTFKRL